jgi:pre-mRNA-splicing factor SYF1
METIFKNPTFARYFDANIAERYCNILLDFKPPRTAEAARVLTAIIESPDKYSNPNGKTLYQYWTLLCQLIINHPEGIEMPQQDHLVQTASFALTQRPDKMDVELVLRTGIKKFSDQVGTLWNSLAKWWILQGEFERARDVYEEGIRSVSNVKDFTMIFDAYAKTEERVLSDAMERLAEPEGEEIDGQLDELDVDLLLARFEDLMERRPFLVSDVLLRQNPHNVSEWKNRIKLYEDLEDYENVVATYTLACSTISPQRATGKLTDLWLDFAKFYEKQGLIDDARKIFEQSVEVQFRKVDDLAHMWCQWAEMEIRCGDFQKAIEVVGRGTAPLSGNRKIKYTDDSKTPQQRLFKCVKLWAFYADLEESVGTVESTKAVYDRILELKIATPQIIINYASFLEEHNYFEEVLFF